MSARASSGTPREIGRMVASLTAACAIGAAVLGGVYIATDRYQAAAIVRAERDAIAQLLALGPNVMIEEIELSLAAAQSQVVYAAHDFGAADGSGERLTFSLDGKLVAREMVGAHSPENARAHLVPLGKLYVARAGGAPAGFVVEGTTRGYKNKIRFLVALTPAFEIAGVRVVEHEEDPGLGAEVATRQFQGQFIGRSSGSIAALDVTRDPMPEDWRAALAQLTRTPVSDWRGAHADLIAREGARPIYAVTGATISSRALTDGVRATVEHFRRRWELLESARHATPAAAVGAGVPEGAASIRGDTP